MAYIVDGIGEFTSLGAALQAAIVPDAHGKPALKALPAPGAAAKQLPASTALGEPAPPDDPLKTLLLIGAGALAVYALYTIFKDEEDSEGEDGDDEAEDGEGDRDDGDDEDGDDEDGDDEDGDDEDEDSEGEEEEDSEDQTGEGEPEKTSEDEPKPAETADEG